MSLGRKRSVTIAGHATSLWLETEFWDALKEIARERGVALNRLIADIDVQMSPSPPSDGAPANLSSALRVYVLRHFRDRLMDSHSTPIAPGGAG